METQVLAPYFESTEKPQVVVVLMKVRRRVSLMF
jgi:hypothetical protein